MELTKTCSKCRKVLPLSCFYIYNNKPFSYCKECARKKGKEYYGKNKNKYREYRKENKDKIKTKNEKYYQENKEYYSKKNKDWTSKNREKRRKYQNKWRENLRIKVLNLLSNGKPECSICGYNDVRALQIDHVHGGGNKEVKKVGGNRCTFHNKILKMDPEEARKDYQVLCANCNMIKKMSNKNERGGIKPIY